jgi:hypothetical protein
MSQMGRDQRAEAHSCICETCQRRPHSAIAKEHRAVNRLVAGLDEKHRRRFVGLLALQWGRGSIQLLHEITGISRVTIRRGRAEVQRLDRKTAKRVRVPGGGRKAVEKKSLRS